MEGVYEQLNPITFLKACIRRWKCFVVSFLLLGILVVSWYGYKRWVSPVYSTTSIILLKPLNDDASDQGLSSDESEPEDGDAVRDSETRDTLDDLEAGEESTDEKLELKELWELASGAGAYVDLIKNRFLISKVVEDMGAEPESVESIYNSLNVTNITSSPYMKITVTYSDPQLSYRINSKVIEWLPKVLEEFLISAEVLVIESPVQPLSPSMPSMVMLVFLEAAGGMLLGIFMILVREIFYTTFRSRQDVERVLGVKNIGFFPKAGMKRNTKNKLLYNKAVGYTVANLISYAPKVIAFVTDESEGLPDNYFDVAENLHHLNRKVAFYDFTEGPRPDNCEYDYIRIADVVKKPGGGDVSAILKAEIQQAARDYDYVLLGPFPYGEESKAMDYYDDCDLLVLTLEHDVTNQNRAKEIIQGINRLREHEICTAFTEMSWKRMLFPPFQELIKDTF